MDRPDVTRRAYTPVAVLLAISGFALAAPALVRAASGGASPTGGSSPTGNGQGAQVKPGNITVTATGDGITVETRASVMLRSPTRFYGNVGTGAGGDTIEIERRGRETGWTWAPTTHGTAASDGSFSAVWPTNHIGQFSIRAIVQRGQTARAASSSPALTITVYRPSLATYYGPGFFGQRTACGVILRKRTLGVANRTLRCGTPVAIDYGGRTIVVPVIDRGPYAHNADWDLTEATAKLMAIPGTATIGAVSLPRR
jgi:rare lipoprotein A